MAAKVTIEEWNGTTGAQAATDKSSSTGSTGTIRFKQADNATVDTNNPMVINGPKYSFIKMIRPRVETAPDTQVSNFLMYTDGTNDFTTSTYIKLWLSTAASTSYVTPAAPSTANDPPRTVGTTTVAFQDAFNFVSTAAWDLSTAVISSTETFPYNTGLKHTMLTLEVESSIAVSGTHPSTETEKLTLSYDEI